MHLHQYADDSQVYISVAISDTDIALARFTACVGDINAWMRASNTTQPSQDAIWFGSGQLLRPVSICYVPVLSTQVKPAESARDLGVVIDSQLSLSAQVTALCCSGYYHQLRSINQSIHL